MPVYFFIAYDVSDQDTYAKYNPGSLETNFKVLVRHGGRPLALGTSPEPLGDQKRDIALVLEFPSREAAHAWHDDPDYAAARALREASTTNVVAYILDAFEMPS